MKVPYDPDKIAQGVRLNDGQVALILSNNTAQTLADMLACVGGSPQESRGRYSCAMFEALRELGVHYAAVDGDAFRPEGVDTYRSDQETLAGDTYGWRFARIPSLTKFDYSSRKELDK
jgi:hypothetical protein